LPVKSAYATCFNGRVTRHQRHNRL